MNRKKHLIDCAAFLAVFLYGNAKIFVDTMDINVAAAMGPLYSAIAAYKFEADSLDGLE